MNSFRDIKKEVRKHQKVLIKMLDKAESLALKHNDQKALEFLRRERAKAEETFGSVLKASESLLPMFQKELKKRTKRLESKVENLNKTKDALTSNNYLLEYKKKDLLILTTKLEEAYDEISIKNKEMLMQQGKISDQNEELESQKEALLDQSDYLHEANERITVMHQEVEKQKDEILKKNEELLILNNEKNNLIGIVAHDLKSPLNQIRGLLSIMKVTAENLSEETLSYIEMMEQSSGRLADMIGKILDVEAIESQKMNLVMEEVELGKVLHSLVKRYELAASQKEIILCEKIDDGLHAVVDRGFVEQVFENLLSNAIKFSPSERAIFINLHPDGNTVICEIKDEGPGLTESDKKKLFGKYQKLSAKPTGNETSTGLGLSIVKKFVEAMNGKIWCESQAKEGASFFVSFPLSQPSNFATGKKKAVL